MKSNRLLAILKGLIFLLIISLLPGCKLLDFFKKEEDKKVEVPAEVKEEGIVLCSIEGKPTIREEDFNRRLIQMLQANPYFRGAGPEMLPLNVKRKFLDRLVEEELFVLDAEKQNLETDPDFQKTLKEMIDLVTRSIKIQFREKKIFDAIQVSENQVKDYFNKNKDRYVKVAGGVLVSGVKFDKDTDADVFMSKVKPNLKDFDKLAKQNNIGKFKEFGRVSKTGGELGMEAIPAPIKEAVLALPKLPTVEKVKVGKDIWVVKAGDKKDTVYFEFAEVKPQVEAVLKNNEFRNKLSTEIDKLKGRYKVNVNEDFFKSKTQQGEEQLSDEEKIEDQKEATQAA